MLLSELGSIYPLGKSYSHCVRRLCLLLGRAVIVRFMAGLSLAA